MMVILIVIRKMLFSCFICIYLLIFNCINLSAYVVYAACRQMSTDNLQKMVDIFNDVSYSFYTRLVTELINHITVQQNNKIIILNDADLIVVGHNLIGKEA